MRPSFCVELRCFLTTTNADVSFPRITDDEDDGDDVAEQLVDDKWDDGWDDQQYEDKRRLPPIPQMLNG